MDYLSRYLLGTMFPIPFLVLCVLSFLTGVSLNGYILFITGCRMERTVSTVWFLNRAIADFIFIVFLPIRFTSLFLPDPDWLKRLSSTVSSLNLFSSAFFLMALSVHRCILVVRPTWARNHCTSRLAVRVLLGMWALSFGFSFRYIVLWESLLLHGRFSDHFWLDEERLKVLIVIQFLVGFLVPLGFILISTFYIFITAKLRRNRLSQTTNPLKILLGLIPTFFICWFPYHVVSFRLSSERYSPYLRITEYVFASVVTYFNSCLNPIFYLTMEDEFRRYRQRARNPQTADISVLEPPE